MVSCAIPKNLGIAKTIALLLRRNIIKFHIKWVLIVMLQHVYIYLTQVLDHPVGFPCIQHKRARVTSQKNNYSALAQKGV